MTKFFNNLVALTLALYMVSYNSCAQALEPGEPRDTEMLVWQLPKADGIIGEKENFIVFTCNKKQGMALFLKVSAAPKHLSEQGESEVEIVDWIIVKQKSTQEMYLQEI